LGVNDLMFSPRHFLLFATALLVLLSETTSTAAIKYAGVNLSCAEFGQNNLPGTYNTHYTYPNQSEVNYFGGKGMNVIRLPFRWERLSSKPRTLASTRPARPVAQLRCRHDC
jgi:aryl-phospho-beta-D-glucosidase BglC (GH1 family)